VLQRSILKPAKVGYDCLIKLGFEVIRSELLDHEFNFSGIVRNEGLLSSLRIALKCISDKSVKRRWGKFKSLSKKPMNI